MPLGLFHKTPSKGNSIHFFFWTLLLILTISCGREASQDSVGSGNNGEPTPRRVIDTVVYEVKDEYLVTVPVHEWVVKAGEPTGIALSRPRIIKKGNPRVIEIDHSKIKVYTPGRDSIPLPKIYTLPKVSSLDQFLQRSTGEYILQHEDTLFAPHIARAKRTESVPSLPMRMKDASILDIQYLGLEQGLEDPNINVILEDSKGNIWFGSRHGGICKYDGSSFTYFGEKEGLNDYITAMIEDRDGNIWIGTGWGIFKYDGKYFTHYFIGSGLRNSIRCIVEARNGDLWFGTNEGMLSYDGRQWTHFTQAQGLFTYSVGSILEDKNGEIWTGGSKGICKYDGSSITHYTKWEGLSSDFINCMIEDKDGNLWMGTSHGICKYEGDKFIQFTLNEGLPEHSVFSLMQDSEGEIWIGTMGGGVFKYDGETFIQYTTREGFSSNIISFIREDKHGQIWLATQGAGVMKLRKNSFTYFAQFENVSKGNVNFIEEAPDSTILIATGGGGLFLYKDDSIRNLNMNQGLPYDFVFSIHSVGNGTFWIGTMQGGVYKYDGESFTYYWNYQQGGSGAKYITSDAAGNLWIATFSHGIKKWEGDSMTYFNGNPQNPNALINRVFPKTTSFIDQDRNGNIWYCSDDGYGAFKYDGECITHHILAEDSMVQWVTTIFEDKVGNMWFGTRTGGVYRYNRGAFTCFTEKEGLSHNSICSIIEDKKGNIWIGTKKGLSLLSLQDDGKYSITAFGTEDGLKNLSFIENAVCLDRRNRLWWGTGEIVTMLDLNRFAVSPERPEIELHNILVNQDFVDFGALLVPSDITFKDVAPFYNYPIEPRFPYSLNHLTFNFSAIDCASSQKIRYQYRLNGLDDQWSPFVKEKFADYRNLPPGKFIFMVRARSGANLLSNTFEYPFSIRWPWWLRWWTISLYSLTFLLMIRYTIQYIVGRERIKSEVQIKKMEVEKMQELDQMKSRFFANISHEFRTPLALLLGPIDDLLKITVGFRNNEHNLLKIMKRNARRLQQLINQLLDLSKLETGKLKLEVSEGDLTGFVRSIVLSFLSMAESKKINYSHELEQSSFPTFYDKDKIEKIITNLVSNALKFTPAQGSVSVLLKYTLVAKPNSGALVEIAIEDNGPGIPDEQKEKIFDRFYQVTDSDSRNQEGSGIGLALVKELVELHRGTILVESTPDSGSTFKVILPVSINQFEASEINNHKMKGSVAVGTDEPDSTSYQETNTPGQANSIEEKKSDRPVILIVEDNPDLREYISGNLLDNFQILQAEDGNAGLQIAIEGIPDLIISDLMMPEMDGMEMCLKLKSDQRTNHIPLLMLTAKADRQTKLESYEIGADDYILKPFDAEELLVRVKNLIDQRMKLRERYRKEFLADTGSLEVPSPEDEFMKRLNECLETHLSESEFNVNQLGQEMHLSRTQLYRKVLALTDHTPSELLRNSRLRAAARMFLEGHRNVTEVMYSVGFNSSAHFAQTFREMYGINPSQYIKKNRTSVT